MSGSWIGPADRPMAELGQEPSIPNLQDHSVPRRSSPALAVAGASRYPRQSEDSRRIYMRALARLSKRACRRRAPAWTKGISSSFAWRTSHGGFWLWAAFPPQPGLQLTTWVARRELEGLRL